MGALMQADEGSLAGLTWLQDLPQRIQQHRQQQQQELHGSQQESEAEGVEEAEEQVVGAPVQMLLYDSYTLGFLYNMLLSTMLEGAGCALCEVFHALSY